MVDGSGAASLSDETSTSAPSTGTSVSPPSSQLMSDAVRAAASANSDVSGDSLFDSGGGGSTPDTPPAKEKNKGNFRRMLNMVSPRHRSSRGDEDASDKYSEQQRARLPERRKSLKLRFSNERPVSRERKRSSEVYDTVPLEVIADSRRGSADAATTAATSGLAGHTSAVGGDADAADIGDDLAPSKKDRTAMKKSNKLQRMFGLSSSSASGASDAALARQAGAADTESGSGRASAAAPASRPQAQLFRTPLDSFDPGICEHWRTRTLSTTFEVTIQSSGREDLLRFGSTFAGRSMSTYPYNKRAGRRDGDPIADSFVARVYENRVVLAVADGCGWGAAPALAARTAVRTFNS